MARLIFLCVLVFVGCTSQAVSQSPFFAAAPTSPLTVGSGPTRVLLADLNGDGHLDLVTSHFRSQQVVVQLGDGTSAFETAPESPVLPGYSPGDIGLGDVNGDRILDLAITRSDRDAVDLFLGDGTGAFRLKDGSPLALSESSEFFTRILHLVDINEDGNLDIVTATDGRNGTPLPGVLLGDGRGGFSAGPSINLDPGGGLYSFGFGDLDVDGHLDVVTVSRAPGTGLGPGRIAMQRGDGTGTFQGGSSSSVSVPPGPRFGVLADVNGDRRLDIVLSHGGSSSLSVVLNSGDASFAPAPGSPFQLETPAFGVLVADVNRDAMPDLLAATVQNQRPPYESALTVLLGTGAGFVAAGPPIPTGPGSYRLTLGDINSDGKLDVVVPSGAGDSLTLLLGR